MARVSQWRELKTGLIGAGLVTVLVLSILLFARVGQLRGATSTLYVYSDDANGVLPGTEVWLSGEKIGQVKRIHFRGVDTDTLRRVSIETRIRADRIDYVRQDARVDIRPGGNLIGTPVIYIQGGTSRRPAVASGDTLATVSSSAFKPIGVRVSSVGDRLTILGDTVKRLAAMMSSTRGTIGALQRNGIPALPKVAVTMDALKHQATRGDGTIGLAMRGDIGERFSRIGAAKDSITALLASPDGSLGRFTRDSTLHEKVAHIKLQLDSLRTKLSASGTLSRMRTDSLLTREMARVSVELAALMADIQKNPRSYISF